MLRFALTFAGLLAVALALAGLAPPSAAGAEAPAAQGCGAPQQDTLR